MSFSDTANAKKYASIAETAAAQAKLYAGELASAPAYAEQAAASATAAAESAQVAVSAQSIVNNLAISASESATEAAASAAEAGNSAAAAVGQCLRVPAGELVDILPAAANRINSFLTFDSSGNTHLMPDGDVAILDSEGKIPVSMIPAIAISEIFVVGSQAAMLALDVQVGDIAKRTDLGYSFILAAEPASTLSNWAQLNDDVLAQLGMSTGATQIGAVDSIGSPTTVQAAIDDKLSSSTLSASSGASLVGYGSTTVKSFLDGLGAKYGYSYLGELQSVADFYGLTRANGERVKLRSWYAGWPTTAYSKPRGGGEFIYQASVPKSKHDGCIYFSPTVPYSTTLSAYVTATGETDPLGNGVWVRDIGDATHIHTDWAGISDGATASSTSAHGDAAQKVFNAAASLGRNVQLGYGFIHLEKAVSLPAFFDNASAMPRLEGYGLNSSYFICYPLGVDTYNLTCKLTTGNTQTWGMKDLQIREKGLAKTAYLMQLGPIITGAVIERIKFAGGYQQLLAQGMLSNTFIECAWFSGYRGAKFIDGNPNANRMIRCQIISMENQGWWIVNATQFQIIGGSMEGCGAPGDTTFRGIYCQGGGSDGSIGLVVDGLYVETVSGYPFYITHSNSRSIKHVISNSNFNNNATQYPVSQVLVLGGNYAYPAGTTMTLEMRGNVMLPVGYSGSASRPDVNISGYTSNEQAIFLDYDNRWIPLQPPVVDPTVKWKVSPDFAFGVGVSGAGALSNRRNVITATRGATGVYTVTTNQDITNVAISLTTVGTPGYAILGSEPSGSSFVVRTYNISGVAADIDFRAVGTDYRSKFNGV